MNNITNLKNLQWRIKGQKLTKEKVMEYLGSPEGRAMLKRIPASKANQLLKRTDLKDITDFQKDKITDELIKYFNSEDNFINIFR